jgi:DNA-binding NtrC family response regulator
MTSRRQPIVLIVDDEENILRSLMRLFKGEAFRTVVTTDPREALALVRQEPVAVLVTDHRMPVFDGDRLIIAVKAADERVVCIRLTGYAHVEPWQATAPHEAVFRTVEKPWDEGELSAAVHEALGLYERATAAADPGSRGEARTEETMSWPNTPL